LGEDLGARILALVAHRLGDRGLRPEQQPRWRAARQGKQAKPIGCFVTKAFAPFLLLADIGLDDADRLQICFPERWLRPEKDCDEENSSGAGEGGLELALKCQPKQTAYQGDNGGQTIGAEACRQPAQRRVDEAHRDWVPGKAGEEAGAQPFGQGPRPGQGEH
jgi:hypothetical protein